MVQIYSEVWYKKPIASFWGYVRDFIIYFLPIPQLPSWLTRWLYGVDAKFVFFIHPRRSEDIFIAAPFFTLLRRFFDKQTTLKIIAKFPPIVIGRIKTPKNVEGLVLSSFFVPEILIKARRSTLKEAFMGISFARKISTKGAIFGLGGWWPIVTRRGIGLKDFAEKKGIVVTNGHCGTLVALSLILEKIAKVSSIDFEDMKVVILGVGKMGTNVARVVCNQIKELILIDINPAKLLKLEKELRAKDNGHTRLKICISDNNNGELKDILTDCHVSICTTTNLRRVIKTEDIPENTVIIDDSRPEAISRDAGHNKIVLEGGLMKIRGLDIDYNFGFGIDNNVFGCLAESYALALNALKILKPTLGDVDLENYERMKKFCLDNDIECGDFKSRDLTISEELIKKIVTNKNSQRQGTKWTFQQ